MRCDVVFHHCKDLFTHYSDKKKMKKNGRPSCFGKTSTYSPTESMKNKNLCEDAMLFDISVTKWSGDGLSGFTIVIKFSCNNLQSTCFHLIIHSHRGPGRPRPLKFWGGGGVVHEEPSPESDSALPAQLLEATQGAMEQVKEQQELLRVSSVMTSSRVCCPSSWKMFCCSPTSSQILS